MHSNCTLCIQGVCYKVQEIITKYLLLQTVQTDDTSMLFPPIVRKSAVTGAAMLHVETQLRHMYL